MPQPCRGPPGTSCQHADSSATLAPHVGHDAAHDAEGQARPSQPCQQPRSLSFLLTIHPCNSVHDATNQPWPALLLV